MYMSFHLSSSVHKRYLFERIAHHCVFLRRRPPAASIFCVLFSVVLTDAVVIIYSSSL
jgi:hypothetical protein